jgi:hypothetical protein
MNVRELIEALKACDPEAEVRLRVMGRSEASIAGVVAGPSPDDRTPRVAIVESEKHVNAVRDGYFEGMVIG